MFTGLLATPLSRPGIIVLACNTLSPSTVASDVGVSDTAWKDWANKARVEPEPTPLPRVEVVDEPAWQPSWPKQPASITNAGPPVIVVEKTTHAHFNPTVVEVHHHHTHQHFHAAAAVVAPALAAYAPSAPLAAPPALLSKDDPTTQLKYLLIVGGLILGGILLIAALSTPPAPRPPPKKRRQRLRAIS